MSSASGEKTSLKTAIISETPAHKGANDTQATIGIVAFEIYVVGSVVHLVFVTWGPEDLRRWSFPFLLLMLILSMISTVPRPYTPSTKFALISLLVTFIGEIVFQLVDTIGFDSRVVFYSVTNVLWTLVAWSKRSDAPVARNPGLIVMYLFHIGCLSAFSLRAGISIHTVSPVVHTTTVALLAVVAPGLGLLGTIGSNLLLISNIFVVLRVHTKLFIPLSEVVIMGLYLTGLGLLSVAVLILHENRLADQIRRNPVIS